MVIEWRECEHEVDDNDALQDPDTVSSLCQCGLLKYYQITTMRMQHEMLQMPIGYWNPNQMAFIVDGEWVSFEVEDIYFMIVLSCIGKVVNLQGGSHIEGALST